MKNLGSAILAAYPDKRNGRDYLITDEGDGDSKIVYWNEEDMGAPPPKNQQEVDQLIEANRARLDEREQQQHMPSLRERVEALEEGGAKAQEVAQRKQEARQKRWQAQSIRP